MREFRAVGVALVFYFPIAGACSDGASDTQNTPAIGGKAGASGTSPGGRGGANAGVGAMAGASGSAAGTKASGGCTADAECKLVATVPAGCARGTCKAGVCAFSSVDADGDGHATSACKPADTSVVVELGDDCDDSSATVFPGAWDGPAGDGKANACNDGIDQDCSGKADDGKTKAGGTCVCTPGDVRACSESSDGTPIAFPVVALGATPLGECRRGAQTCLAGGTFGPCTGAIPPAKEACNGKDDDCDGKVDLTGDMVPTDAPLWLYDQDDDLHADKMAEEVKACDPPPKGPCGNEATCPAVNVATGKTHWRVGVPKDDCADTDGGVHPGATEVCNGKDDDCNAATPDATAPGVETWFWDGDGDGYVSKAESASGSKSCANPGEKAENCRDGAATCTDRWVSLSSRSDGEDCNDEDPKVFPGAWDGPAGVAFGVDPDGLAGKIYALPMTPFGAPGPTGIPFARDNVLGDLKAKSLSLDWWRRGPLPTRSEYFAVELGGTIVAPETGTYAFEARLLTTSLYVAVAGVAVLNAPPSTIENGVPSLQGTAELTAGVATPISVVLLHGAGAAGLDLVWSGPGVARQTLLARSPANLVKQPNLCDGVAQNCAASEPDATNQGNRTCAGECFPGTVGSCGATYAQGSTANTACQVGSRTCSAAGRWGACSGGVGPSAEICGNTKDDDCNGMTDESSTTFYLDSDGDGRGDPTKPKSGCGLTADYVANTNDDPAKCGASAPADPTVYVGAPEICDGKDNNCDGKTDESFDVGGDCVTPAPNGGVLGACAKGGTWACEPGGGRVCVKKDPLIGIDQLHGSAAPSGGFDWNCDGKITKDPAVVYTNEIQFFGGAAVACATLASGGACTANSVRFTLKNASQSGACGEQVSFVSCATVNGECGPGSSKPGGGPVMCK